MHEEVPPTLKTFPDVTGSDAKVLVTPMYGDDATDELCIPAAVIDDVGVVCNLPDDVPSPETRDLLDLFFSKGILLQSFKADIS